MKGIKTEASTQTPSNPHTPSLCSEAELYSQETEQNTSQSEDVL